MTRIVTFIALLFVMILSSCENDPYDSGDGELSHVTTAFGETSYNMEGRAFKFVTDEDKVLNFTEPYGKANADMSGKQQRSLLYYYLTDDKNKVKPYVIINVLTTDVIDRDKVKHENDDPIKVDAVWLSENKKYINLSLKIKTSSPEDSSLKHKLGMLYEGCEDGTAKLRLIHDDGNIPGNYTVSIYFSVRVSSVLERDSSCSMLIVSAMTPDGLKDFEVKLR